MMSLLMGLLWLSVSAPHIAIVVPYRNRVLHLAVFKRHIIRYFEDHHPNATVGVWVVEQADTRPFNRAWLANVGFVEAMRHQPWECVCLHDVDLVPQPKVPYLTCDRPVQLGGELEHFNWRVPYYVNGGIVSMSPAHWRLINGYSNSYVGWGGEDDDLYHRLRINDLLGPHGHIQRPPSGHGRFNVINQSKSAHPPKKMGTYAKTLKMLQDMAKNSDRWRRDGLNSLAYSKIQSHITKNIIHIKVTQGDSS